jgi:hypothetical protein
VKHEAVVPRVQVRPADHHESVDLVQDATDQFGIVRRGNDNRNSTGGLDRLKVSGRQVCEARLASIGCFEITIDTDNRFAKDCFA